MTRLWGDPWLNRDAKFFSWETLILMVWRILVFMSLINEVSIS